MIGDARDLAHHVGRGGSEQDGHGGDRPREGEPLHLQALLAPCAPEPEDERQGRSENPNEEGENRERFEPVEHAALDAVRVPDLRDSPGWDRDCKPSTTKFPAIPTPAHHATTRQRRESSRPSGNSSRRKVDGDEDERDPGELPVPRRRLSEPLRPFPAVHPVLGVRTGQAREPGCHRRPEEGPADRVARVARGDQDARRGEHERDQPDDALGADIHADPTRQRHHGAGHQQHNRERNQHPRQPRADASAHRIAPVTTLCASRTSGPTTSAGRTPPMKATSRRVVMSPRPFSPELRAAASGSGRI